jgi:tRNA U34 5-carboxymethylaminomethyl modifying GTPase MnmE/TrmE
MIKAVKSFARRVFSGVFKKKGEIKLGFYGSPNAGKTSLANRICQDWLGEDLGAVSKMPHETRQIQIKEKVVIERAGKRIEFKLIDTPGIATKIDFEDFMKFGMKKKEAQNRAKEATQGIIESIKWLDDMDAVIVLIDSTMNPYSQVNITIIGNLVERKIPVLIVANKIDLKKADVKKVQGAFPEYDVVGISARDGENMEEFYEELFKLVKRAK